MEEDTLTALSQRDGAFWVALALLVAGSLLASATAPSDTLLDDALIGLASLILVTRIVVGVYRILRTSAKAGKAGYEQGKEN